MKPIVVVGSINLDLAVTTERVPRLGETVTGTSFEMFTGGKGANQAVAAARLGHPVFMIGKVGSDVFSTRLLADLRAAGVDTAGISIADTNSGMAAITLTPRGENSIIVVPGANHMLTGEDLERYSGRIAEAGMVLTQLETPMETLETLCRMTAASGVPLMLDPAPAQPISSKILRSIDWITPNEVEAQQLTAGTLPEIPGFPPITEPSLQADLLLNMGARNVLLKLGERGAYLASAGARIPISPFSVKAVDTTGAGDAFNAAFAVGLLRGLEPPAAARCAAAAAALSVTRLGAHSMPSQVMIDEFLSIRSNVPQFETN